MKDSFGREIKYMRISLTDKCNYRCKYCMPEEGIPDIGHDRILRFEDIERIARAAVDLGISKFRLTGGEPLVRRGIVDFVRKMKSIEGLRELTMTTNGSLLAGMADELAAAGLDRVNISLDTLRYSRFKEITRGGEIDDVVEGINAAVTAGLTPVKINAVVMKGFNDDEILDFLQLTFQHDYEIRFIEMMPFKGNNGCEYQFMSNEEIKAKMPALRPVPFHGEGEGVAQLFKYPSAKGRIGFISAISDGFCGTCNKVRVTADGKLKTCLHSNSEFDLKRALSVYAAEGEEAGKQAMKKALTEAITAKEKGHTLRIGEPAIDRNMNRIGG